MSNHDDIKGKAQHEMLLNEQILMLWQKMKGLCVGGDLGRSQ